LPSSAAVLGLPGSVAASFEAECFAAARKDDRGVFSAALFNLQSGDLRSVELPGRGHAVALRPDGSEWVAFARRPGRFGVAVPFGSRPPIWFASKPDRHFFGDGVFSADGKLLYATENDYAMAQGIIGVRDATDGYRQIGEFSAHGMEPHDIALLADGRTLVIANGGIQTHPDSGAAELNLADMQPSLAYVVAIFSRSNDFPPLCISSRSGISAWPQTTWSCSVNYIGSVAVDAGGSIVAASAPKGAVITYWDAASRRFLGTSGLNDGCGLAPTHHSASFLLTSGEGWLATADPSGEIARQSSAYHWDNHAILVR
jgi:hypothetical protein